jgi:hypothetical protein
VSRRSATPKISHQTTKHSVNWIAVGASVISMAGSIGTVVLWGGRIDARVESTEKDVEKHERRITDTERENAKQDTAIASAQVASKIAYEDIIRRLASIETKLDNRR